MEGMEQKGRELGRDGVMVIETGWMLGNGTGTGTARLGCD